MPRKLPVLRFSAVLAAQGAFLQSGLLRRSARTAARKGHRLFFRLRRHVHPETQAGHRHLPQDAGPGPERLLGRHLPGGPDRRGDAFLDAKGGMHPDQLWRRARIAEDPAQFRQALHRRADSPGICPDHRLRYHGQGLLHLRLSGRNRPYGRSDHRADPKNPSAECDLLSAGPVSGHLAIRGLPKPSRNRRRNLARKQRRHPVL